MWVFEHPAANSVNTMNPSKNSAGGAVTLSLAQARILIDAALSAARERSFRPMCVVVVDRSAQMVAMAREDGASSLRTDIALGKAAAAVGMGVNTRVLSARADKMPVFFGAVAASAQQKFIPHTGAVLILDEHGVVLGAAGASGGSGDEDEQIVMAGVVAAGLAHG